MVDLDVTAAADARSTVKSADGTAALDYSASPADAIHSVRPKSSSSDGTGQRGGKKSSVKLVRNPPSKISNISKPSSPPPPERPATAIDPLSHHILKRTNTENTIPQKLRNPAIPDTPNAEVPSPGTADISGSGRHGISEPARSDTNQLKEKKKGVSFLSRFSIIGGKKKEQADSIEDDESELGDLRTEGMNAHVFSSSIGANGYIPQHKEPPRYIKVRAHNKKEKEYNRMFLAQELFGTSRTSNGSTDSHTREQTTSPNLKSGRTGGAVWATEFSKDGKHLAAAGKDHIVRVWSVISTSEERQAHEHEEEISEGHGERLSAPVFRSNPVKEFEGHTGTVLDLSWSKNNFLLSSSMDKTVRLWHISRQECLCTFKHKDFVTSIAFHPKDDRFFLAGSLDSVLRLWSIPDKSVAFWNQLPDLITAVAFTPDGKTAMAGVLTGLCLFYETEGLKYHTQIHVRSSRGKNAKGSKITGIKTMTFPPDDPDGEVKVLITSNDSRVRLYNLRDKSLEMKFRGHENTCSQIKASFSDDARYVICGSEDRKAYIWSSGPAEGENKDKRPLEQFDAHSDMVTAAVIAPTQTRQLLAASGDPIYDLCNPPPVTLLSRAESNATPEKRNSDPISEPQVKKTEESPAYLTRSMHHDGNIIITADHSGVIKVFRQDCAYQKRRNDQWETASSFSRKIGPGMLGRTGSLRTRGSHSRRNSMSQTSVSTQLPSDRILSWRNSIASNASLDGVGSIRTMQTARSERSVSPGKFSRASSTSIHQPHSAAPTSAHSQPNLALTARQQQYSLAAASPPPKSKTPASLLSDPDTSIKTSRKRSVPTTTVLATSSGDKQQQIPSPTPPTQPPTPSFSLFSAATTTSDPGNNLPHLQHLNSNSSPRIDSMGKYQFWNPQTWRSGISSATTQNGSQGNNGFLGGDLQLSLQPRQSVVSKLSSEEEEEDESPGDKGTDGGRRRERGKRGAQISDSDSDEDEALRCRRCGGKDFRAKKTGGLGLGISTGVGGGKKFVCVGCGLVTE